MGDLIVNGRQLGSQHQGGVVRYAREVTQRLDCRTIEAPSWASTGPLGHLWEQSALLANSRDSVLFSPANFGPVLHPRHIVTIHDLSPVDHPEWFGPTYTRLFRAIVPRLARSARQVITDSEFSRKRISEAFGVNAIVAGVGVGPEFFDAPETKRTPTALVVGSTDPRKNVAAVLKAWPAVSKQRPDAQLIVVGGDRSAGVFSAASNVPGSHPTITHRTDVDDLELITSLKQATVMVYMSLYEGFGLPVLEAMATGTQVVCSDIPPLREFADGLATFVDPTSSEAIAAGIIRAFESETAPAAELQSAARAHSWERTTAVIADVAAQL